MYFFIFRHEDMLKLCLNFSKSQTIYAYKRYAYKKKSVSPQYVRNQDVLMLSEVIERDKWHYNNAQSPK